jgi:ATP-dependent RNA helicase RhlE
MTKNFSDLGLVEPLLRAIRSEGYDQPTPIQAEAVPEVLRGRDILGCAQTGTGKTAAFALPILQLLDGKRRAEPKRPRALVLSPTRELAAQIGDSFRAYGKHLASKCAVIFGGVGQRPQVDALRRGVDILVATPGRLLDLVGQGHVHLDRIEIAVLDEADRMLDMGFIHDVEKILARLPAKRQSLLFSATMPREIRRLADDLLTEPVAIQVDPVASTVEQVKQHVLFVSHADKRALLGELLEDPRIERALVFTRTKHGANKVAKQLSKSSLKADAIHGNKSQSARQRALDGFKRGQIRVLVATDIAARGIDVEGVTHVINYDLPNIPESYVHRIGRTARAGSDGAAISFCASDERPYLKSIEKLIKKRIHVLEDHPYER